MPRHENGLERFLQPQQAPQMAVVAAPALNDFQLVALVASKRDDLSPEQAVRWAQEVVAEVVVKNDRFQALVKSKREAAAKAAEAA